jgi:hypothetical protein
VYPTTAFISRLLYKTRPVKISIEFSAYRDFCNGSVKSVVQCVGLVGSGRQGLVLVVWSSRIAEGEGVTTEPKKIS